MRIRETIKYFLAAFVVAALSVTIARAAQESGEGKFYITLEDVSRIALTNNFDIQLAKYDAWIAQAKEGVAESIYDTMFKSEVGYQRDKSKRTSTILGSKSIDNDYNVSLSKQLPTGTTLDVGLANNRNWTDASFATNALTHESTLSLSASQDLGKNFFGLQDRAQIKITRLDIQNSTYAAMNRIEAYLGDVQKAYWDLVYAKDLLGIEQAMVEEAKKLYDLHLSQKEDGLVEPPDVLASEANYKQRLNNRLVAENRYQTQSNRLKLMLNVENDLVQFVPTENYNLDQPEQNFQVAMKNAFKEREDYKQSLNNITSRQLVLSIKKNSLWPEINLSASLARNGLGDHFKQSIKGVTDEDNTDFSAGFEVSFPLENTKARAELSEAQLEDAKALLELKKIERQISIEVIDQVRLCNILREVARNQQLIASVQTEKLEEELKRYQRGRSETDTIIRFQEDVLQASQQALEASNNYHHALVDLTQTTGIILDPYWEEEL